MVSSDNFIFDVDLYLERFKKCELISELQVIDLCNKAKEILQKESNVVELSSPITVCGDTHGQFFDVLELFKTGGPCPDTKYIFLGDYVDRGHFSVETFLLLLSFKVKYPDQMHLIRGNHESRQITVFYGFYEECQQKYGSSNVWHYCTDVFDHLPLAALIDNKIMCVHGGLSPILNDIDTTKTFSRKQEVPHEGPMCDLLWSDPEDTKGWWVSPRGAGYLFGSDVSEKFMHNNGLEFMCRAHQLVMEGYKEHFGGIVITVWSAPNYCYRCGNVASILSLNSNLEKSYLVFDAAEEGTRHNLRPREPHMQYFL